MSFLKTAQKGFKSVVRGASGSYGYDWGVRTSGFDWNTEAGLRYDNSVVYALIMYAWSAMTEVEPYVRKIGDPNSEIVGHPVTELLKRPNPWYDYSTMVGGWVISELVSPFGMSHTYKHRSGAGKLIGLEYIPHFAVNPFTMPGSGNWIDFFYLSLVQGRIPVDPKDILQQRFAPFNPRRPQVSYGPLNAAIQEICTDNEALNYTAALLKNAGCTPHLISPAGVREGETILWGKEQKEQIKNVFEERITGDNRGLPLMMPLPIKVDNISMNPSDMNLAGIQEMAEVRICAPVRINPAVLNLSSGLKNGNSYSSVDVAHRQSARDFTLPYMKRKAAQLTWDLIPELGNPDTEEVAFRIENIGALQEDKTETATRNEIACGGPWETVNEIREREGKAPIEGGDKLREQSSLKIQNPNQPGQQKL